jgi:hypothetical protein
MPPVGLLRAGLLHYCSFSAPPLAAAARAAAARSTVFWLWEGAAGTTAGPSVAHSASWFQGLGGAGSEEAVMGVLVVSFVLKEVADQCQGFMLFQVRCRRGLPPSLLCRRGAFAACVLAA